MADVFATDTPDEAMALAMRRIRQANQAGGASVSDLEGLALDQVVLNMGPQHPSTHGVLRLVVTLDGEIVRDVIPVIGYLHRCKEKIAEKRTYYQYIPIVDRTEYVAGINCEWGYVLTVEKLAGIVPTRRAEFIRVIMAELNRIASHQIAVGTFTADLSPLGTALVFYMFRDREKILDLLEEATGARMMFNYFRFGGVRFDLPDGWVEKCRAVMAELPRWVDEYRRLVEDNAVFLNRTVNKGVITRRDAIDYAITGPNARASGIAHDLRRTRPYSVYPELDFDICLGERGDTFDRYKVRVDEIVQSQRIVLQCLDMMPKGPVQVGTLRPPYIITPPPGSAYTSQENPRGEYGTYIVSDGSRYPYRLKFRDPCFINLQLLPKILRGNKIADAVAISGSIDMVLGGTDR
jgi:NADH-quinone oxidoreductase subunit D